MKLILYLKAMILVMLPFNAVLQAGMPSADDTRNIERHKSNDEQVRNMKSSDLINLYDRVLHEQNIWAVGEADKLAEVIEARKDPSLDEMIIALADRVLNEDAAKGRLDTLAGKRTLSRTEEIMNLLGRRKTKRAYEYVYAQATNRHSVVRACIIDVLGPDGWDAAGNTDVTRRLSRLFCDEDPEVSYRSAMALEQQIASRRHISEYGLRALVDARDGTVKGILVVNRSFDLHDALDAAVENSSNILTKAQEKATPEEKKELIRLLDVINNRRAERAPRGILEGTSPTIREGTSPDKRQMN